MQASGVEGEQQAESIQGCDSPTRTVGIVPRRAVDSAHRPARVCYYLIRVSNECTANTGQRGTALGANRNTRFP